MRLIDADALIPMMKYATTDSEIGVFPIKIGFNEIEKVINEQPTIEPEPQIIYSKAGYIMSLHKEYGCTLIRAEEAHNKALEYLRDKAMMKG